MLQKRVTNVALPKSAGKIFHRKNLHKPQLARTNEFCPSFPSFLDCFSITFAFVYVSMGFFYICFQFLFLPRFWESSKNRCNASQKQKKLKILTKKNTAAVKKTTTIRLFPDQTSAPNWKENVAICADGRLKFTQLGVF